MSIQLPKAPLILCIFLLLIAGRAIASPAEYFAIQVVDDQTGRGVPLVELETPNNRQFFTDSAGYVAFNEPGLMNQKVWFTITSHGYEFPADGFGYHGTALDVKAGASATVKIKRINIAERLYRVTGEGIYRDSILLGKKVPIKHPLINAGVLGQDSIWAVVHNQKIYWLWGDTTRAAYLLGNFHATGATSPLPSKGGLPPSVGVNLDYFEDKGFVAAAAPLPDSDAKAVWIDAVMTVNGDDGKEKLIGHYIKVKGLNPPLESGLVEFNDAKNEYQMVKTIDLNAPVIPAGHPFPVKVDGVDYYYFPEPYPTVRVKATYKDALDLSSYEAFTPLVEGSRYEKGQAKLDRKDGKLIWAWKKNTPSLSSKDLKELIDAGQMKREESPFRLQNADDSKPVLLHECSVYWNDYRKRYVMIFCEVMGTSMLGETWFAESKSPEGPWVNAKKIATQEKMDLYNPTQHPFFDEDSGKTIYFEGTYVNTFSGNPITTPGYNYNQIMYRLDLSDPRLKMPE